MAENVQVFGAGSKGAAVSVKGPIRLTNSTVHDSNNTGVFTAVWRDEQRVAVEGAAGDAAVLTSESAVQTFPTASSFTDNRRRSAARLQLDRIAIPEIEFRQLGIPYVQDVSIQVHDGSSITFDAGVEYRFAASTGLEIGWNMGKVELQVNGTETAPVIFRGVEETKGFWNGIAIDGMVSPIIEDRVHADTRRGRW